MTQGDVLYRFHLRTMALAEELGNAQAACGVMGVHRSTYYRWKEQVVTSHWRCSGPGIAAFHGCRMPRRNSSSGR